jgi:formate/nitrite transporter FocA (FNT family)
MNDVDALIPADMARRAEDIGVAKASMPLARLAVLGVLGGAFIGLGAAFSTAVTAGDGLAPGIARLLGGVTFSLGLVLVVVGGAELFTGNMLIVMAAVNRRVRFGALLRNWGVVYVANLVGAVGVAALVFWAGQYRQGGGAVGERALAIATTKADLSFSARSTTDRILAVMFPITAFVACGFEHSIANMYFLPLGMFVQQHVAGSDGSLTWGDAVFHNLLPVTLGNMIGGGVLVGLTYWFVYLRGRPPAD